MRPFFLSLTSLLLCTGCAFLGSRPKSQQAGTASEPRYVGEVATVNPDARFVLIDVSGFQTPQAGTDLQTRHEGEVTGTIRVDKEVRRPFAVADVLSGNPATGDGVWSLSKTP